MDFDRIKMHDMGMTSDNGEEEIDAAGGPETMTIAEFNRACLVGAFTTDDGVGYYGTAEQESGEIVPVDGSASDRDGHAFTHIWWYGK